MRTTAVRFSDPAATAAFLDGIIRPCLDLVPCTVILIGSPDGQPPCCAPNDGGVLAIELVQVDNPLFPDGGCDTDVDVEWLISAYYCAPTVDANGGAPAASLVKSNATARMLEGWRIMQRLMLVAEVSGVQSLLKVSDPGRVGWSISLRTRMSVCRQGC